MNTRMFTPAICLAAAAIFFICTPNRPSLSYTLNEQYRNANLSARPLFVSLPDEDRLAITNPKDATDDYGGMNATPASRVKKFYLPIFFETFRSFVSGDSVSLIGRGNAAISTDSFSMRKVSLPLGDRVPAHDFSIPSKASMDSAGLDSAILVSVDRLAFRRNNFYVEYYWDDKTRRPANLEVEAVVLIWDYKQDAPVFHGAISTKEEFQIAMQRKHWDESARNLAKKIVLTAKCL